MAPHYKNKILLEVVKEFLPVSTADWERVATVYHARSNESSLRSVDDLKRQWKEKLCNKGLKPTGKSGDANDQILAAQNVEKQIFQKKNIGNNGDSNSDSSNENSEELEDENDEEAVNEDQRNNDEIALFGENHPAVTALATAVATPNVLSGNKRRGEIDGNDYNSNSAKTKNENFVLGRK